ncbi:MAG: adenylate/guanylate cyclase domain-containing protein [Geminicoccaceae bacterium]
MANARPPEAVAGLDEIVLWLSRQAIAGIGETALLGGLGERLVALGVPIGRLSLGAETLHPTLDARSIIWRPGKGVEDSVYSRFEDDPTALAQWYGSPFYYMAENKQPRIRRRLNSADYDPGEFSLLNDFRAHGLTDYYAAAISFGEAVTLGERGTVHVSFSSDSPDGFSDADLATFDRLLPHLGLAYMAVYSIATARTLMTTYLGHGPAKRVLAGDIARGDVSKGFKVLWFSDIEGFTRLADTVAPEVLIDLLNTYADIVVSAIEVFGGDVVKFMGDGVLATFVAHDPVDACARALDATATVQQYLDSTSEDRRKQGKPVAPVTIALHYGEVLYGNIGSEERLDFTVVGPAVNEVARMETMCRQLDQRVIISKAFADAAGNVHNRLVSMGRYALKGIGRPVELFTLDPEAFEPLPA